MASALELIEKVQETFASKYGLTFFMTDREGNVIISIEGKNKLYQDLLEQGNRLSQEIQTILGYKKRISKTLLYEIQSGMYMMVSPVSTEEDITHYLWAGVLTDENFHAGKEDVSQGEAGAPVLKESNRSEWLGIIGSLAELSSLCLQQETVNPVSKIYIDRLRDDIYQRRDASTELFIQVAGNIDDLDFMGLAEQSGDDMYTITKIAGKAADKLQGVNFITGEGFLGRAVLTEKRLYWENIGRDRRSKIFNGLGKPVQFLFTDTLRMHDGSTSILFGGSFNSNKATSTVKATAQMTSALVESSLLVEGLREENSQQLTRLSSLIEICRLMASTPDPKRMVLILLDISINLVEGPFSSIIINDRRSGKGRLITRGTFDGDINEYVEEVMRRTGQLSRLPVDVSNEPQIQILPNGKRVIECPLAYGNELMGILSVGVTEIKESEMQELLAFLQTLSIIGGVSLQLAGHKDSGVEEEKVAALQLAVAEFDKNAYSCSKDSAELASLLGTRLELSSDMALSVVQACQLSYYSPSFVFKMLPGSDAYKVMETGDAIIGKEDVSPAGDFKMAGYIYALCNTYIMNHKIEDIDRLERMDHTVYENFLSLVRTMHVSETEFDLPSSDEREDPREIAHAVKAMKTLSPREQEVLILVSKGRNNQEIAEDLYISTHTVKNHITKIFNKLNVSDRVNAISKVYRNLHNY